MLVYQRVRSHRPCDGTSPMFAGGERKTIMSHKELEKTGDRFHLQHVFFSVHDFWKRESHLEKRGGPVMGILNRWIVYFSENPSKKWMITRGTPMT